MIEQLPIIQLLVLLGAALVIPLFRKRSIVITTTFGLLVLLVVLASNIIVLVHVQQSGAFYYVLGNHTKALGIELLIDDFSTIFVTFIIGLSLFIYIFSIGDVTEGVPPKEYGRYYTLMFILLFALSGIVFTNDIFNTYVFMEILSITTCSIISIKRKKENYSAAFRYVMLNEIASLSFLLGIALLYMVTGYTNIELMRESLEVVWHTYTANVVTAIGFMVVGLGIKAAIFPMHIWLPDAHANAPSSSSAWLSGIVVKVYLLILIKVLYRVFALDMLQAYYIPQILTTLAVICMLMGSLFALGQKDMKRMLAYSSIAQIGTILLAISLFSELGLKAAFFHIISHAMMKTVLFLAAGSIITHKRTQKISEYTGIAYEMPLTMTVFGIAALGMIGFPVTSGLISKLNLGAAMIDSQQTYLIGFIILSSLLNALYYLPIIINAFLKGEKENHPPTRLERIPLSMQIPFVVLALGIMAVGIFPGWLHALLEHASALFGV
jgi:multicomponent Na+:H+ antiporter subunit D